ncbi:DNA methyltransferase [Paenibacillus sp. NRS-1782]|uniref:DNA methyltransferase n=1 Tax=unclassified Paenibacillus TaxID=185978 RepID=UPI003D2D5A06
MGKASRARWDGNVRSMAIVAKPREEITEEDVQFLRDNYTSTGGLLPNAYAGGAFYTPTHVAGWFPANCVTTDEDAFYSPYFNITPREVCKKASKADRGVGNTHPTVKPTDLMAWLVRLVTPPGGTVMDPFAGSGSTLVAAKREGFGFIGIEREPEYVEIIRSRVETAEEEVA